MRPQSGSTIDEIAHRTGAKGFRRVDETDIYALEFESDRDRDTLAREVAGDPGVLSAESDDPVAAPEPTQGDPFHFATDFRAQPLPAFDTVLRSQIDAPPPLTRSRQLSSPIVVAVLDTGVVRSHPALSGRLVPGFNALDEGASEEEVADGTQGNHGMGHGTMVAGVVARLAPEAKILPIRILDGDGIGTLFALTRGIEYALAHGAKVINISCEIGRRSDALDEVLNHAGDRGALIVASAGNHNVSTAPYPAGASHVLAVGSVEADDTKSAYSNYGSWLGVVAPGSGMESAWWQGGYATWSGTSFAAPCVSAEAALVMAGRPLLKPDDVAKRIRDTARSIEAANPLYAHDLGRGMIQIRAALAGDSHSGD